MSSLRGVLHKITVQRAVKEYDDLLLSCPFLMVIKPAAETFAPCKNDECWKAPDCLMPMYRLLWVSATCLFDQTIGPSHTIAL